MVTRMKVSALAIASALAVALGAFACATARPVSLLRIDDPAFTRAAPDSFDVQFVTTKGTMLVRARRWWSPNGVDRFYALAANNYFDTIGFYRTIGNFVAQFGFSGDTAVNRAWRNKNIPDDTVRVVNQRGTLSFARGGPRTRSTQFFFNLVDNTPRLDTLNTIGFPPIAQVIDGIEVLDKLNTEYSGVRGVNPAPQGPSQDSIARQGNAYLRRHFPRLDYIVRARVVRVWR